MIGFSADVDRQCVSECECECECVCVCVCVIKVSGLWSRLRLRLIGRRPRLQRAGHSIQPGGGGARDSFRPSAG